MLSPFCFSFAEKTIVLSFAVSQGHFPQMENIAAFKPVSTSPTRSTCGVPERASYCQSASSRSELMTCYQAFCVQECPYRSTTPPHAPLLLSAHRYVKWTTLLSYFKKPFCQPPKMNKIDSGSWGLRLKDNTCGAFGRGCWLIPFFFCFHQRKLCNWRRQWHSSWIGKRDRYPGYTRGRNQWIQQCSVWTCQIGVSDQPPVTETGSVGFPYPGCVD